MATKTQRQVKWVRNLYGASPYIAEYPEAASQSFKKGELVYLASGKVTVCASAATTVFGIALEDASTSTNTSISVQVLSVADILSICVYNATSASAITAVALVGTKYPLVTSSNKHYLLNSSQSNPCFAIIGIDPRDEVGDVYGRYLVTVMAACLQSTIGA